MVTQSLHVSSHSSSYGSSLLDRQEYLRTRTWWLWMIWTWIWLFWAHFWIPLFKQQFILDKTMRRIDDTWTITFGLVWDSSSMKLENWSVNKKKSLVETLFSSKILRRCRQAYCAAVLIESSTPEPTSSPTVYCVGKCEMILLRFGRAWLSGIRKTITSRI